MSMVLGITGGIAAGKSTVMAYFSELGAEILDADEVARDVVVPGSLASEQLIKEFGPDIVGEDGRIDRRRLGAIVFDNEQARKKLNEITHPQIIKILENRIDDFKEKHKNDNSLLAVEIPLLIECNLFHLVDKVIVVASEQAAQIHRLKMRGGLSTEEAAQRVAAQMPLSEKEKFGDWVIRTDGTLEETRRQVESIWHFVSD
jgi:dephospho-CoA kinase